MKTMKRLIPAKYQNRSRVVMIERSTMLHRERMARKIPVARKL
jgi:hypothetical protein